MHLALAKVGSIGKDGTRWRKICSGGGAWHGSSGAEAVVGLKVVLVQAAMASPIFAWIL